MIDPVLIIDQAFSFLKGAKTTIMVALAVAGLCLPLGYCTGARSASARFEAALSLANTKALQQDAAAGAAASEARVADAVRINANEEELLDAIAEVPDSAPDAARVALGCQRLRNQGTGAADLPAVCRP